MNLALGFLSPPGGRLAGELRRMLEALARDSDANREQANVALGWARSRLDFGVEPQDGGRAVVASYRANDEERSRYIEAGGVAHQRTATLVLFGEPATTLLEALLNCWRTHAGRGAT